MKGLKKKSIYKRTHGLELKIMKIIQMYIPGDFTWTLILLKDLASTNDKRFHAVSVGLPSNALILRLLDSNVDNFPWMVIPGLQDPPFTRGKCIQTVK